MELALTHTRAVPKNSDQGTKIKAEEAEASKPKSHESESRSEASKL